ncbi:general secretion pathway protein G [Hathewaya proteolytica DSM 3090]|uniref:General secretion pathway protein G n=1 Tax=Hathewaya proteolytica DSM 3090 TaxID=1121331 RepID=A0A1M6LHX2_9CLOT|nr:type II secretion system protein [Hathewaya proteolytica]SHJ70715.1 general secretion pathway protein G [Hathewaya proteolytica DSM 3090]
MKKKGFTLIELIVVIAILGVLAAVLLPKFSGFTDDARGKSALTEAKNCQLAIEYFNGQHGKFPTTSDRDELVKCGLPAPVSFDTTKKPYIDGLDTTNGAFKYVSKDNYEVEYTGDGKFQEPKKLN